MPRSALILYIVLLLEACALSDYVRIRPNHAGVIQNRPPVADDFSFYASIGAKQYEAYGGDVYRASEVESARLVKEYGLCPKGYSLDVSPGWKQGDHGFGWTIRCNR